MKTLEQFARFVMVGGLALCVNMAVTYTLTEVAQFWYFYSFLVGVLCSWTFVFFANTFFTFGSRPGGTARYTLFAALYSAAFVINAGLVYALTTNWGVYYPLSIIAATAVTTLLTFFLSKHYIYGSASLAESRPVQLLRTHWAAVVVGLAVGLLTMAPFVAFRFDPVYQGVEMIGSDAEEHYVARMQEAYDGYPSVGNTFMPDKQQPYGPAGLGEWVVHVLGKTLGMQAAEANVFAKLFFPMALVWLIYAWVYAMFRQRATALLSSVAPILGYNLVSSMQSWVAGLQGTTIDSMFLIFARPINPQVSSVNLFGALLLLYRGFHSGRKPHWFEVVGAGVLTGTALYISPYVFVFLGSLLLVSFVWFLWKDRTLALPAFLTGAVALLCTIPFAVNYWYLHASAEYAAFAMRTGVATNFAFVLPRWLILLTLAVLLLWPKEHRGVRTFFLLMFAALFIIIEQNVLTGVYLFPGHIHWYITKPLAAIMLGIYMGFASTLLWKWGYARLSIAAVVLACAGFFYNAALWQINSYVGSYPLAHTSQSYAPVLEYLNTQKEPEVVWADTTLSLYIPMYTHHNAPNNVYAIYYLNPFSFYTNSVFLDYRLRGVEPDQAMRVFMLEREWVNMRLYGMYGREISGNADPISDKDLEVLSQQYAVFFDRPLQEVLRELGVTVLVARASERGQYVAGLEEVHAAGAFVVYTTQTYTNNE